MQSSWGAARDKLAPVLRSVLLAAAALINPLVVSTANAQERPRGDALQTLVAQGVAQSTAVKLLPIALMEAASVGSGYASTLNSVRGLVLDQSTMYDEELYAAPYDFRYVEDLSELRQSLAIKASAAYAGASARASLLRESKMSKTSAYVLFKTTVTTHRTVLNQYRLGVDAIPATSNAQTFFNRFGDSFVSSITYGGELIAMMEFSTESASESTALRASVRGQVSGFSASASVDQVISSLSQGRKVRVSYFQTGGAAGREVVLEPVTGSVKGGLLAVTPDELLQRFRDFPAEVLANKSRAWPLYAEFKDYSVTNWPAGALPVTSIQDQDELERLSEVRLLIAGRLATAAAVANASKVYPPATVNVARAWRPYLSFVDTLLEEMQLPYLRRLPEKPKRTLLTFQQYNDELLLMMPGAVSRANAGLGCDPYDLDIKRSGDCLLGPEEDPLPVVPWPEVASTDKHLGWQVNKPDRGGEFWIPCRTGQQPTADKVCGRSGPNDGIVAIPSDLSSTQGCGCGCNLVQVTCIRFKKLDAQLFKPMPAPLERVADATTSAVELTAQAGRTWIRFTAQTPERCGRSIGAFRVRAQVVGAGGLQEVAIDELAYWSSGNNQAEVAHVLPGMIKAGTHADVQPSQTYCKPLVTR